MIDTPVSDGNRQQLTTNPSGEPTLTQLVSGITDDAQRLMVQQYQMLRAELKEDLRRTKSALAYLSVGIVASLIGVLFLVVALPLVLNDLMDTTVTRPWAGWAIIGGVMLVLGVVGLFLGKRIFEKNNPLPDKTLNALEENLSWIANNRN
jgi:predicted lysophospholipase L1 biosynthesis ABC-type transport system permease subunit